MLSLILAVVWVLLAVKNHQQPSLLNRLMWVTHNLNSTSEQDFFNYT